MAVSSHKGAISFGLVHIPVALYTATQDNDIHFNQLCKQDNSRVRYKKVCAGCGKEVSSGDIIKGFEYDKDKYVIVTDEDFEKIKTEKDRSLQILHFADLKTIQPVYYDKTYHAVPETGGEKAFELLRTAMLQENKVAIAKTVMGNSETLLCIIPTENGILIEKMFYQDEIKEIPKSYARPELNEGELTMAKTLIESMAKPFEPSLYKDEYQERLRVLIEDKINGKEIIAAKQESGGNVIDLMEALQRSIEQSEEKPAKKKTTAKKQQGA
ncbi:Ku protein [Clostridium aminobutyricum]|uniref:Non-homologous end joining protein Ku n=1 Tax=Clostridium aminobutyricum TaxID=33953 RepID=A0A939D6Z0_CLOAM|nr:Ku protein [Clostridium aminobutyricum]MBN7772382.1 Ku protein [Clostridium aminobutyricum]